MKCKPIYEFLIWDNCKNKCKFCFQRDNPRLFNKAQKEIILNKTLEFINSNEFEIGSHILICGGEIFDTPSDKDILQSFFSNIIELMLKDTIDLLYINTNLIYSDTSCLFWFLDKINENNLFDRLKFTTSYDSVGRFKTKEYENLMLENLLYIKDKYRDCNIVVNSILTNDMCQKIISNEFNPQEFMRTYNCWINFIPYIIYIPELAPSRNDIFSALLKIDSDNQGYLEKYISNLDLDQDKRLFMYKDNQFTFCSCELSECGHSVNFKRYSDKNTCFICDLKRMINAK